MRFLCGLLCLCRVQRRFLSSGLELSALTAISPVDGRYGSKVADLRPYFSEFALIKYRVEAEVGWLQTLAEDDKISEVSSLSADAMATLASIRDGFSLQDAERVKEIERTTNHDVKAVEYLIKEKIAASASAELEPVSEFVHFSCTSEDINNLAHACAMRDARRDVLLPGMEELEGELAGLAVEHAAVPMLARTHGQPATPTTVGKELANFVYRLSLHRAAVERAPLRGKVNGATGSFQAHTVAYPSVDWEQVSKRLIETHLGLEYNPYTTQIEPHDGIAELFHALSRYNNVALDFCRDMWGYISLGYWQQVAVAGETGSSTMPHKINPIFFENAEGNLGVANALLEHLASKLLISRYQRDLSDSTVLRVIGPALAHSLLAFRSACVGLSRVTPNTDRMRADLDTNVEVLGEAVQTVMRRYGAEQPYERLKDLTRGKRLTSEDMKEFVQSLDDIPEEAKQQLLHLEPHTYTGIAEALAKRIAKSQ